jgi:hypothetical protein
MEKKIGQTKGAHRIATKEMSSLGNKVSWEETQKASKNAFNSIKACKNYLLENLATQESAVPRGTTAQ